MQRVGNTARIGVRLRPREREALERISLRNERSLAAEVRRAIQLHVLAEERGHDEARG
jgi:hypothetical protein